MYTVVPEGSFWWHRESSIARKGYVAVSSRASPGARQEFNFENEFEIQVRVASTLCTQEDVLGKVPCGTFPGCFQIPDSALDSLIPTTSLRLHNNPVHYLSPY